MGRLRKEKSWSNIGIDLEHILDTSRSYKCRYATIDRLGVERVHCQRLRLYWYNGQYYPTSLTLIRTCCSPVTTLCRFQRVLTKMSALPSSLSLTRCGIRGQQVNDRECGTSKLIRMSIWWRNVTRICDESVRGDSRWREAAGGHGQQRDRPIDRWHTRAMLSVVTAARVTRWRY